MLTRKDYLLRYIELLAAYLRRRANGERDAELDEDLTAALEMRLDELEDLSEAWLRSRLSTADTIDAWRALLASEYALSLGQLRATEERPVAAAFLYERAVACLEWAFEGDLGPANERVAPHIATLAAALRTADVVIEAQVTLMQRAEAAQCFGVAEDVLFDVAKLGWPEATTWGEGFYQRLAALDPDVVRAGGLDPADLADDLADLRRLGASK